MATKKAAAKKAVVSAKKAPRKTAAKKPAGAEASVPKMTKTRVVGHMAERMAVRPKQIAEFFSVLVETATRQTREAGEFTGRA